MTNFQYLEVIVVMLSIVISMALKARTDRLRRRLHQAKEVACALNEDLMLRREHARKAVMVLEKMMHDGCPDQELYDRCARELSIHALHSHGCLEITTEDLRKMLDE